MARDRADRDEDEPVTEINVELDRAVLAELTIDRTGESSVIMSADLSSSPADSEPRTLEPQTLQPRLSVRGLVAASASPASIPGSVPVPDDPSAPHRVSHRNGGDDDDDKTTRNVEGKLLEAFSSALAANRKVVQKTSSGAIITPSEPFRVTSQQSLDQAPTAKSMSSASLRAASGPASDRGEPTAKRPPAVEAKVQIEPDPEPEEETVTDALKTLASQDLDEDLPETEDGPEAEEETQTDARQQVSAALNSLRPRGEGADTKPDSEEVRSDSGEGAGSLRMAFPKNASELVYDSGQAPAASKAPSTDPMRPEAAPMPAHAPPPPPPSLRLQMPGTYPHPLAPTIPPTGYAGPSGGHIHLPPPPGIPSASAARATFVLKPKKKSRGGLLFALLFFVTILASGAVVFHSRYRPPWMMRIVNKIAPPPPAHSASTVASASASATPSASASASASATPSASASASASATPSATPSATASGRRVRVRVPKK